MFFIRVEFVVVNECFYSVHMANLQRTFSAGSYYHLVAVADRPVVDPAVADVGFRLILPDVRALPHTGP